MGVLKNHPGMKLRDDAANALNALEDKHGVIRINSAARTVEEQNDLIRRWRNGEPGIYKPAIPAETSNHVKNGGIAVDIYNYRSDEAKMNEFGFRRTDPNGDPVHYEFFGWSGNSAGGNRDEKVAREQNFLNAARGESLAVDGIYGPATRDAYKRYQEFLRGYGYGGAIDGIWGGGTQDAHARYYAEWEASRSTKSPKSAGELNYSDIQAALNKHGYGLEVDGIWGPKSSNALADFQSRNGLTVDRIVGPQTWAKLNV